jgi:hypothetical protein
MHCRHCDKEFAPKTTFQRFCSAACRQAAWQQDRGQELTRIVDSIARELDALRALQRRKPFKGARE